MKWTKASEHPAIIDIIVNAKLEGKPVTGSFYKQHDGRYAFGVISSRQNIDERAFGHLIWLDESEQLLSGVPLDEEIDLVFPSEIGQTIIMEPYTTYEDLLKYNYQRRIGAKQMRDRLAPMIAKLKEQVEVADKIVLMASYLRVHEAGTMKDRLNTNDEFGRIITEYLQKYGEL